MQVDDNEKIVFALGIFFSFCPELDPEKIRIKFQLYSLLYVYEDTEGSQDFNSENIKMYAPSSNDQNTEYLSEYNEEIILNPLPTIIGTGQPIANIEELIRQTEFCNLLETLFIASRFAQNPSETKVVDAKQALFEYIQQNNKPSCMPRN